MKTKIIPFDLETAKKIQAGKIKGKIKTFKLHNSVRLLCDNFNNANNPKFRIICAILRNGGEYILACDEYGCLCNTDEGDLVLEVPDNEPQFKPFDRVLVRDRDGGLWHPSLYATTDGLLYYTIDCKNWQQCIPYEGNEDLVGTTNKLKEN